MSEEHIDRKRRRRRRRKRPAVFTPVAFSTPENPATVTPQDVVAEADEDTGPIVPGRARGGAITLELPQRFLDILEWGASARRQTVESFATEILRGALSGMKPAYREATTGRAGGTVTKAALGRMVAE